HQEYTVFPELGMLQIIEKYPDLSWTTCLGAAGMPGKCLWLVCGLFSTVIATKSCRRMVVQLAKQASMKVIASAGSDGKVQVIKNLSTDVAFNYKTTDTRALLQKEGPIDVYVTHNVGGDSLDAALQFSAINARFLECGMISGYNTAQEGIKNLGQVVAHCIHMHSILVFRLMPKHYQEFYATIPAKIARGELKHAEDISTGLHNVGDVILAVLKGMTQAKPVVAIAEE
ncbi:hypothetical protein DFH09DRAFT_825548, partial [Mycena vulgaris]